jgi:hypothetical protein
MAPRTTHRSHLSLHLSALALLLFCISATGEVPPGQQVTLEQYIRGCAVDRQVIDGFLKVPPGPASIRNSDTCSATT